MKRIAPLILVLLCAFNYSETGEIRVYDGDGQFLGVHMDDAGAHIAIFVPGVYKMM